jgi:hypothetical protein
MLFSGVSHGWTWTARRFEQELDSTTTLQRWAG